LSDPITNVSDLTWDSTGHLAENYLLVNSHPACTDLWVLAWAQRPDFAERTIVAVADSIIDYFDVSLGAASPDPDAGEVSSSGAARIACNAVCIDRGVEAEKLKYVIPDKVMLASLENTDTNSVSYGKLARRFQAWLEKVVMLCEIGFINWTPGEAKIFWVDGRRGVQVFTGTCKSVRVRVQAQAQA